MFAIVRKWLEQSLTRSRDELRKRKSKRTIDDKPECELCVHQKLHKLEFLLKSVPASVCTHPSALKYNDGSVWSVRIARELCRGRKFEPKKEKQ